MGRDPSNGEPLIYNHQAIQTTKHNVGYCATRNRTYLNPCIACTIVFLISLISVGVSYANGICIPQVHRITVVALHLGVFKGIVNILREALWLKSIEESNDKLHWRCQPTNLMGVSQIRQIRYWPDNDRLTQETLILREVSSWEDNERERLLKHF